MLIAAEKYIIDNKLSFDAIFTSYSSDILRRTDSVVCSVIGGLQEIIRNMLSVT